MSFILDALKKSELERQRQAIPGLMESAMTQRPRRLPVWAVVLVALLGINLIVLLYVLTRAGAQHPAAVAAATAGRQPAASEHFSPMDAAPVYAPEIPVDAQTAGAAQPAGAPTAADGNTAAQEAHAGHPARAAAGVVQARPAHKGDPLLTDEDSKADAEVLPTISEVNLTGREALPDLHLDVHVYATRPAERFVYINMRKYREGATLAEGPVLERIRRDGVILDFHGLRFVLPRQQ